VAEAKQTSDDSDASNTEPAGSSLPYLFEGEEILIDARPAWTAWTLHLAVAALLVLGGLVADQSETQLAGIVFGLFMIALTLAWGLTTRLDAVALSELHRWSLPAVSALVAIGSLWYGRALGLL